MWLLLNEDRTARRLVNLAHIGHIDVGPSWTGEGYGVTAYGPAHLLRADPDWQEFTLFSGLTELEAIQALERLAGLLGDPVLLLSRNDQTLFIRPRR